MYSFTGMKCTELKKNRGWIFFISINPANPGRLGLAFSVKRTDVVHLDIPSAILTIGGSMNLRFFPLIT